NQLCVANKLVCSDGGQRAGYCIFGDLEHTKRIPVSAEAVISDPFQVTQRSCFIGNDHSPRFEQFQLFREGLPWPVVCHTVVACSTKVSASFCLIRLDSVMRD